MKFKKLEWVLNEHHNQPEYSTMLFCGYWEEYIISRTETGDWNLYSNNNDESEIVFVGKTLKQVKKWAQVLHEDQVREAFMEPAPKAPDAVGKMVPTPGNDSGEPFEVLSCEEYCGYLMGRTFRGEKVGGGDFGCSAMFWEYKEYENGKAR